MSLLHVFEVAADGRLRMTERNALRQCRRAVGNETIVDLERHDGLPVAVMIEPIGPSPNSKSADQTEVAAGTRVMPSNRRPNCKELVLLFRVGSMLENVLQIQPHCFVSDGESSLLDVTEGLRRIQACNQLSSDDRGQIGKLQFRIARRAKINDGSHGASPLERVNVQMEHCSKRRP